MEVVACAVHPAETSVFVAIRGHCNKELRAQRAPQSCSVDHRAWVARLRRLISPETGNDSYQELKCSAVFQPWSQGLKNCRTFELIPIIARLR